MTEYQDTSPVGEVTPAPTLPSCVRATQLLHEKLVCEIKT